jgi:predicted DCC family thiol-disulfide oxidoreductase YuxK
MQRFYILYDPRCGLCSWARRWLARQPAYLDLTFVPAGSERARRLFPGLARPGQIEELIVVSDDGAVYRDSRAWIMSLYALEEYREWAVRLAHPLLLPLARQAFALLSKNRRRISRWLRLASEVEIAETLRHVSAPSCTLNQLAQPNRMGS